MFGAFANLIGLQNLRQFCPTCPSCPMCPICQTCQTCTICPAPCPAITNNAPMVSINIATDGNEFKGNELTYFLSIVNHLFYFHWFFSINCLYHKAVLITRARLQKQLVPVRGHQLHLVEVSQLHGQVLLQLRHHLIQPSLGSWLHVRINKSH